MFVPHVPKTRPPVRRQETPGSAAHENRNPAAPAPVLPKAEQLPVGDAL